MVKEKDILLDIQRALDNEKQEVSNNSSVLPIPSRVDVGWSDYVLGEFELNEVVIIKDKTNGTEKGRYPKVHGLRRLAEKLVGNIVASKCTCVNNNVFNAGEGVASTWMYEVEFLTHDGKKKVYSDVGEIMYFDDLSKFNNIEKGFCKFPAAIASTRAEARALRKALGLNCVSWDELDKKDIRNGGGDTLDVGGSPTFITETQKAMLTNVAARLKLPIEKYISLGKYPYKELNQVSFSDAVEMLKELDGFQRSKKAYEQYCQLHKI